MSIIPCRQNLDLRDKIRAFADVLKSNAHTLGDHGLSESEFYNSGLFRGAIERIRGQFAATMSEKRLLARAVLQHMVDRRFITAWESSGEANRHDYTVTLISGRIAAIELKGCLDGNNTNIFDRPPHANEFVIWSICSNPGADPGHNVWSGIHTRLSAEIITNGQLVDGLVVWDMVCGTLGRPCPKVADHHDRLTRLGTYELPPPCIYLFPGTVPHPRNNPHPKPHELGEVEFLKALNDCFEGTLDEVFSVGFQVEYQGTDTIRRTSIRQHGKLLRESAATPIRRS